MQFLTKGVFFYRGYTQALFFLTLVLYVWFFPQSDSFEETWLDPLLDAIGVGCLVTGELVRLWAVSHAGKCTRSRRLKAPLLIMTGPYAYVRHPIYLGNFLITLGIIVLAEVLIFIPIFLVLFALQYRAIVSEEESFLSQEFGEEFDVYRARVQKWFPTTFVKIKNGFAFGANLPHKEFGTIWGIVIGAFFFEWIETPMHRQWILSLYSWLIHQ